MAFSMRLNKAAATAARPAAGARRPARFTLVRAEKEGTVFFGGKEWTVAEFEKAKAEGTLPVAEPVPVPAASAAGTASFGELMAFGGAAPELINGRLAMLGFIAAIAAEFSSGEGVLKQLTEEPTGIIAAFAIFIAASFAPLLRGVAPSAESLGPFNAAAEKLNGRAAMIGFAALLAIEAVRGSALF